MLLWFRKSEILRTVSLITLFLAAVVPALSQDPVDKAWTVLQSGLSNSSTDNRTVATRLLGGLPHNQKAQDQALKALADSKPEVRAAGAEALGNMQAKSAIPQLQQLCRTDQDAGVVISCAKALVNLGDPLGFNVYYAILTGELKSGASLMDEQKKMLKDPKKLAQFGFETGVGFIPFGGLTLGVFKSLTKDDVSPIRAAAADVLAGDPDPKTTTALKTALSDKSWLVRAAAADALGKRKNPSIIPALEPVLADDKEAVRYTAAVSIIRLNGTKNSKPAAKSAAKRTTKPK
ncbi:MAG TPA: HEAT repeat domain-containing protein [Edaphobacter sp.]